MKIISCIKARKRNTRLVTVNGSLYTFSKRPDGEFVADVADATDAEVFLRSRHFRRADGKPVLKAPGSAATDGTPGDPGDATAADDDATNTDAVTAEASQLIEGSAGEIGRAVGNASGLAVIRRAVELEQSGQKRKNVIALLTKTLESAKLAGVTD